MAYNGGCHCAKIAFTVDAQIHKVIECNCSICRKRGYLLAAVPRSSLQLQTSASDMSTYTFNQHRIRHQFCPVCGVAPFGLGTDGKGQEVAAINVRCLEGLDLASLEVMPFDGRSL